jgi:hypothetical protein
VIDAEIVHVAEAELVCGQSMGQVDDFEKVGLDSA